MSDESSFQSPLTLTAREFMALAQVSRSKFYALRRRGLLDGLESPVPGRWSRPKVEAWLAGQTVTGRRRRSAA